MTRIGKTTSDRLLYGMPTKRREEFRPTISEGSLGEVTVVEFTRDDLRQRIRDCCYPRGKSLTPERSATFDELIIEAVKKGWTPIQIARAGMFSSEGTVSVRIRRLGLRGKVAA